MYARVLLCVLVCVHVRVFDCFFFFHYYLVCLPFFLDNVISICNFISFFLFSNNSQINSNKLLKIQFVCVSLGLKTSVGILFLLLRLFSFVILILSFYPQYLLFLLCWLCFFFILVGCVGEWVSVMP